MIVRRIWRRTQVYLSWVLAAASLLFAASARAQGQTQSRTDGSTARASATAPSASAASTTKAPADPSATTSSATTIGGSAPTGKPQPRARNRERLSDLAELDRVIELYMAGQYQQCTGQLEDLLDMQSPEKFVDPSVLERGRLYFATCALMLGERDSARLELKAALEDNPLMSSPDSLTFPPPLVSLFLEVRDEVQQLVADREREQVLRLRRENEEARRKVEERRRREEQLEKLASQETVVRRNSRFIAALPLGAGQFQNGNVALGTIFLVGQSVGALTSITSLAILESLQRNPQNSSTVESYNKQTQALYDTMKWSLYGALALYAASIIEAQITFKPETKLVSRKRKLPPELSGEPENSEGASSAWRVTPTFAVTPQGGYLGVDATF